MVFSLIFRWCLGCHQAATPCNSAWPSHLKWQNVGGPAKAIRDVIRSLLRELSFGNSAGEGGIRFR